MDTAARDLTLDILRSSNALLEGHFELRSGLHSDRFFQCARVQEHPKQIARLAEALADRIRQRFPRTPSPPVDTIIAPALGGIIIGHELARALDVRSIFAEKKNDALQLRRFHIKPRETFIVAEDVITRGGRVRETIDIVRRAGGIVSAVAVLVDRSGGQAAFDVPVISLLEMEPVVYDPTDCPLCRKGIPLEHPGS